MSRILEAMSDFAACNSGPESDAQACAEHLQEVRAVTFSFSRPLLEKYGTFIARCDALIEKGSPFIGQRD
eukprot:SAG31_NODE_2156_length_6309_cov_30.741707_4_plen_70_part_00